MWQGQVTMMWNIMAASSSFPAYFKIITRRSYMIYLLNRRISSLMQSCPKTIIYVLTFIGWQSVLYKIFPWISCVQLNVFRIIYSQETKAQKLDSIYQLPIADAPQNCQRFVSKCFPWNISHVVKWGPSTLIVFAYLHDKYFMQTLYHA